MGEVVAAVEHHGIAADDAQRIVGSERVGSDVAQIAQHVDCRVEVEVALVEAMVYDFEMRAGHIDEAVGVGQWERQA